MTSKLVIGKLQEALVRKFTHVEVVTLTVWFYLSALGLILIIWGLARNDPIPVVGGITISILSGVVLDAGLHREHDIATESGNVGPDA